jgi:hypothetical protein
MYAGSASGQAEAVLAAVRGTPVLTVTDGTAGPRGADAEAAGPQDATSVGAASPGAASLGAASLGAASLGAASVSGVRRVRGIINFVISDGHVRFEIDKGAAAVNGLTISSKLLSLAVRVLDGR